MPSNKKEEKPQDLFGFENESEQEDNSSDNEEIEDSRFSKARLQQSALDSEDDDESDEDSDVEDEHNEEDKQQSDTKSKSTKDTTKDKDEEGEQDSDTHNESAASDSDAEEEEEEEEEDDEALENDEGYDAPEDLTEFGVHDEDEDDDENTSGSRNKRNRGSKKKIKALTPEELEKFEKARKRTGVCYLSRIPPFMPPHRVRQLLEKFAEIGRIYLVPEDAKTTARRKKYTKNRRTNFIEGWVEFKDKKKARALAEYLNMRQIGGKRKSQYYHEMWNIKYLPKFKWHHLTEQMAHERQARQQRLRNEIAQANRENKTYIQNVQRAKMLQSMEEKKRKREGNDSEDKEIKVKRTFTQRGKVEREVDPSAVSGKQALDKLDSGLKNVLGNIFAKK